MHIKKSQSAKCLICIFCYMLSNDFIRSEANCNPTDRFSITFTAFYRVRVRHRKYRFHWIRIYTHRKIVKKHTQRNWATVYIAITSPDQTEDRFHNWGVRMRWLKHCTGAGGCYCWFLFRRLGDSRRRYWQWSVIQSLCAYGVARHAEHIQNV